MLKLEVEGCGLSESLTDFLSDFQTIEAAKEKHEDGPLPYLCKCHEFVTICKGRVLLKRTIIRRDQLIC